MQSLPTMSKPSTAGRLSSSSLRGERVKSTTTTTPMRRKTLVATKAVQGEILITVDKPLGVTLKARGGGIPGVVIDRVGGNGAKAGLKSGDVVMYHSSFFGDELWPADQLGFSRSAINAMSEPSGFYRRQGCGRESV